MRKTVIAVILISLLFSMASGCAMLDRKPTLADPTTAPSQPAPSTQFPTDGTTVPTQPPTTQPPVTEPPITEPPVTEPPATEPPVTEPPVTEPQKKLKVCIDAGHQRYGISAMEPNGPGSDVMKAKLTSGTRGVSTGIAEYQLTLDVSLLLEQELIKRGYDVVMIRRTNDCPLSNAERAQVANDSGADIFVRIHANGSENSSVSGALCCAPTQKNPYLTERNIAESIRLSRLVVDGLCDATGAKNRGLMSTDTMTGINWCQIPVTIVEMGFMSNPEEDQKMATDNYRQKIVWGIADGIDAYFGV